MNKKLKYLVSILVIIISFSALFIAIKKPFHFGKVEDSIIISEESDQKISNRTTDKQAENILQNTKPIPEEALESKYRIYVLKSDSTKIGGSIKIQFHEWCRAHAGFANWQQIEPIKGEYNWTFIDDYVKKTQAKDNQILFTIWPFTNWDQETGNSNLEWQKNDWGKRLEDFINLANRKGKPCDMDAYRKFLRLLVERYDGDGKDDMSDLKYEIKYWEIGNEPDLTNFFQGADTEYFEILKESYISIKEADSKAKVLIAAMPSLGYENFGDRQDFGHAEEVLKLGGGNYFDIMNYHAFGESERLKDILKKYNLDKKPYWITEVTPGYSVDYLKKNFTVQQMKDMFDKEIKNGAEKIFIEEDTYKDLLPLLQ